DFGDGSTSGEDNPIHTFPGIGPYDVRVSVVGTQNDSVEDSKRVQFPGNDGTGLTAIYSDSQGNEVSRIDEQIDFEWELDAPDLPGNTLDVTWTGVIVPSVSGHYVFQLQTDGNALLLLDGSAIIDKRGRSASTSDSIYLEAARRYKFVLV